MPRCASCGQENPDIARFCLACGVPMAAATAASQDERRVVSVLFVDLVDSTARADGRDPEDFHGLITAYYERTRSEIESFGGYVEKFIGDAVVGVFGAPTAFGDDAERAVRAALAVRDAVEDMNLGQPELDLHVRLAVNTGLALVALGARRTRGEPLVAGDVTNTASRLQAAAPVDGILVGHQTYEATREAIVYEPAEPVAAKGKALPIDAWRPVRAALAAGERPVSRVPMIGRTRELNVLRATWERVTSDRIPYLLTVLGPTGVGKTRLSFEFGATIGELGGRVVRGRSLPYRESTAYGALAMQVKHIAGIYESDAVDVAIAKLHTTVGALGDQAASAVADHLAILLGLRPEATVSDRETLFQSARAFVEAVVRRCPTVFVFEDAHWADESLLDLVELLAGRLQDLPVLLLVLSRPELLEARPGWGSGVVAGSTVPLGPLHETEARQLAASLLSGSGGQPDQRAGRLAELAGGNPLFIEQLAASIAERATDPGRRLPTSIRAIVAARLDALAPPERTVVLAASVAGRIFWRGQLDRMSGGTALRDVLASLEEHELIERQAESVIEGDQQYTFKHVLIRDVAYELLPRARRRRLHAEAARFLEESTSEVGEAAAQLARHWRGAGDDDRAIEYFLIAGAEAESGWAKERAVALYREACELVPEGGERRTELLRRLAVAQQALFHVPDARLLKQAGTADG